MNFRRPGLTDEACIRALGASLRARWSDLDYLRASHPRTPVEVSVSFDGVLEGTVETNETITMSFGEQLLSQIISDGPTWRRRKSALRYHLAQCPLSTLPQLEADVPTPACVRDAAAAAGEAPIANLWLCIGSGTSSLHYDCFDGLLLVVCGVKRCTLLPPSATCLLRPRAAHGLSANHSTLSELELNALLASPDGLALLVRLTVRAGESVFIPAGWWHQVCSGADDEASEAGGDAGGGDAGGGDAGGGDVTIGVNWWWRSKAHRQLLGRASNARAAKLLSSKSKASADGAGASGEAEKEQDDDHEQGDGESSSYVLRCAFEAATRSEQRRMLAHAAGCTISQLATVVESMRAREGSCCDGDGDSSSGSTTSEEASEVELLAQRLVGGAAGEQTADDRVPTGEQDSCHGHAIELKPDEPALVYAILTQPVQLVISALSAAASRYPARLAALLVGGLGPAGAHALGQRLQEAQEVSCAKCAARAAAVVDRAFECVDQGEAEQRAVREQLLSLSQRFADEAASKVLTQTLGLNTASVVAEASAPVAAPAAPTSLNKRRREG